MQKDLQQINEIIGEVKDSVKETCGEVNKIKDKFYSMEAILARNTESLETHVRRTDLLEDMVKPLHEERLKFIAVKEYKQQARSDLLYKLKLPVMIATALGAIGTTIAWIAGVF